MRPQPPSLILTTVVVVLGGIGLLCGLALLALDRHPWRETETPDALRKDAQI